MLGMLSCPPSQHQFSTGKQHPDSPQHRCCSLDRCRRPSQPCFLWRYPRLGPGAGHCLGGEGGWGGSCSALLPPLQSSCPL